jgi:DNA-binding FrmR family transcriptional regulator
MIDPLTAIAVATKAFNTVKRMVAAGREIEDTLTQIGAWYGAVSDFNEAKRQAQNPPLFKRLVSKKSVEQEAMDIYVQQKKVNQQENELRTLLLYTYGTNGYQELVDLRRKIREQREQTIYAQARKRKAFFWNTVALLALSAMAFAIYLIISAIAGQTNG